LFRGLVGSEMCIRDRLLLPILDFLLEVSIVTIWVIYRVLREVMWDLPGACLDGMSGGNNINNGQTVKIDVLPMYLALNLVVAGNRPEKVIKFLEKFERKPPSIIAKLLSLAAAKVCGPSEQQILANTKTFISAIEKTPYQGSNQLVKGFLSALTTKGNTPLSNAKCTQMSTEQKTMFKQTVLSEVQRLSNRNV
jgi:hypothetical protein